MLYNLNKASNDHHDNAMMIFHLQGYLSIGLKHAASLESFTAFFTRYKNEQKGHRNNHARQC